MLFNKRSYSLLILLGFVLSCYTQSVKPSITLDQNNGQPSTYFINGLSTDGSRYVIEPEFPNESYLFTPIPQVSYSTAHMFKTDDFKYNQIHIGNKYHYYQTNQHVFMARLGENGLQMTNFAEISVPDIIYSQQVCTHIVVDPKEIYSVSACRDTSDNAVYLIMVSYISSKPFYVQALKTSLKEVVQMKLVGQFLYVLDHDATTNTNEKLHIYRVNLGSSTGAKQAMEITGYIDQAPFGADKLDIGSFDINVVDSIQKVFLADKSFGIRTIDFNTESKMLYNALSNSMNNAVSSIAVHTCTTANSCNLVVSLQDSTLGYASWGRNGNVSAFDFISVFSLPKQVTINQKLTINQDFLTVMSQATEGNRLHFFHIPTDKFTSSINTIGAVDYKPVSSYQNDFTIVCTEQDGSCKLFVPNPINHIEEYILRPQFGVKIQSHAIKSTYFNVVSALGRSSTIQTVRINGVSQQPVAEIQSAAPAPTPAPAAEQPSDITALLNQFRPRSVPIAMMPGAFMKQPRVAMGYNQALLSAAGAGKNSDSDSDDDDTSITTFHGWFIIFLIILAGLAGVAYLTNRPEKAPVVANSSAVEAPSVLDAQPIRRHLIDQSIEPPVQVNDETAYRLMPEELPQEDENLVQVDTGLENDTHEIDLEATR